MPFHENTDASHKATFAQYGVIILDSLFKADLSQPAVYKPESAEASHSVYMKPKGKKPHCSLLCNAASNKIDHRAGEEITTRLKKRH